ncbi:hypothetical protein [Streptomyces sp. NPDC002825]|uniref:hypothetical protein n=1 Tax=Streptomyces sp. NPDC002825 TaxID=3154666 RepID=UPI00332137DF
MRSAKGSVVLDGKAVEPETRQGDPIAVRSVAGNAVTGDGGTVDAVGCGLWFQLPALAPGKHRLRIRGSAGDFSTGVDHALTVVA